MSASTPLTAKQRPSVIVDHVTVRYMTPSASKESAREVAALRRIAAKMVGRQVRTPIYPVRDVSLLTYDGDAVALVGENGAGKSSILRVIGGFERPYDGQVYASSQPAHLGVNAAMITYLNAYRNARIGALALGLSSEEADEAVPRIIEYAELGNAAHRAVRTYSTGMRARLRFAISAIARPRILLIDEALGAGDAVFAKKTKATIDEILADAGTIFMVSHYMSSLKRVCNRGIWMHKGRIIMDAPMDDVAQEYTAWTKLASSGKKAEAEAFLLEHAHAYTPLSFELTTDTARPAARHLSA